MCLSHSLDEELSEGKTHVRITPVPLPVLSTTPGVQQPFHSPFHCIQMKREAGDCNIRL